MGILRGVILPLALTAVTVCLSRQSALAADWSVELRSAQKALAQKEYSKAFTAYSQEAVHRHNPLAQFTLALFYKNGWGRPVDAAAACKWMEKAAAGSVPAAVFFWGECLEKGKLGAPDPARAAIWYEKAAALGYVTSLCSLGRLYMAGEGVAKDPAKAVQLCRQAADRNIPSAQVRLGLFYLRGDPAVRDLARAYQWFVKAAEKNDPEAFYFLGRMDLDGLVGAKDRAKARYWFETAASMGYVPAYYPTASLYFHAPVDPRTQMLPANDLAKAYLWLSATAQRSADVDEKRRASEMLREVRALMPQSWESTLDAKVSEHLRRYSALTRDSLHPPSSPHP